MEFPRSVDEVRVEYFRSRIRAGLPIDQPVGYYQPDGMVGIVDGIQRVEAYEREGYKEIPFLILADTVSKDEVEELRVLFNRELRPPKGMN